MTHFIKTLSLIFLLSFTLVGCQQNQSADNSIKVGTISGPETQLMTVAKQVAKQKYGLDVKIIEFTDYTMPNAALNDGSIDANMFQHQPYLDAAIKAKNYKIAAVAKTFIYPMGIYSKKVKNLSEIPMGAIVAIPNDPSNEARALLLLSKAGLITLKPGFDTSATPVNILSNPKNLQFKELDAAQLPRVLQDVTISVINTNYAIPAGLSPDKDAIYEENKTSPYANLVVTRIDNATDPKVKELVASLQSPEVVQAAKQIFNGGATPAWREF